MLIQEGSVGGFTVINHAVCYSVIVSTTRVPPDLELREPRPTSDQLGNNAPLGEIATACEGDVWEESLLDVSAEDVPNEDCL